MLTSAQRKEIVSGLCATMGAALQQEYRLVDGAWWLFTKGKPARVLQPDEVQWHVERQRDH